MSEEVDRGLITNLQMTGLIKNGTFPVVIEMTALTTVSIVNLAICNARVLVTQVNVMVQL